MLARNVGKWVLVTLMTMGTGAVAASCGGANNTSTFNGDAGEGNDATAGGDGPMGHSDSSFGGGDGPTGCTPKTCAAARLQLRQGRHLRDARQLQRQRIGRGAGLPRGRDLRRDDAQRLRQRNLGRRRRREGGRRQHLHGQDLHAARVRLRRGGQLRDRHQLQRQRLDDAGLPGGAGLRRQRDGEPCASAASARTAACTARPRRARRSATTAVSRATAAAGRSTAANGSTTTPDCPTGEFCGWRRLRRVRSVVAVVRCDGGTTTTLTGYVYDPANHLPVYNALVYVPVGAVQTPHDGRQPASVRLHRAARVRVGVHRHRRQLHAHEPAERGRRHRRRAARQVAARLHRVRHRLPANTARRRVGSHLTLPSTHLQGNIPRFAIDTGGGRLDGVRAPQDGHRADASSSIRRSSAACRPAAQRIHMYEGSIVAGGAIIDANTPTEDVLTETASVMDSYDVVLFPCQGGAGTYTAAQRLAQHAGEPHHLHRRRRAHVRDALPLRPARRQRQLLGHRELDAWTTAPGATTTATRSTPPTSTRRSPAASRSRSGSTRPSCTAGPSGRSRSASSATTSVGQRAGAALAVHGRRRRRTAGEHADPLHVRHAVRRRRRAGRAGASSTATSTSRASANAATTRATTFPTECPGGAPAR